MKESVFSLDLNKLDSNYGGELSQPKFSRMKNLTEKYEHYGGFF